MIAILCITDPLSHTPADSTVELYQRLALDPEVEFFHAHPRAVTAAPQIAASLISGDLTFGEFQNLESRPKRIVQYESIRLAFSRVDDPLPAGFMEQLAMHEHRVRFVNAPSGLLEAGPRAFHQKIAGRFLPDWIATRDAAEAATFIERHHDVVAKINQSYGGKGVRRIRRLSGSWSMEHHASGVRTFPNLEDLLANLFSIDPEPFEFVRFLKNIAEGDKRVLVLDGEIMGAYLRRSSGGGWIHNGTLGGFEERCEIGDPERAVIAATWPEYQRRNLQTLGYDFLMDDDRRWILSEINAGNVGGYGQMGRLLGKPIFEQLINWMKEFAQRPSA